MPLFRRPPSRVTVGHGASSNRGSASAFAAALAAQQAARPKDVREAAKAGPNAIPRLTQYLTDPSLDVRAEAVKQIIEIGPPRSLDPLVVATRDADAQVQNRATDGLVNFYLPGYFKSGVGASLRRVGTDIKGRFTDTNDQVIDRYMAVRPEVVTAIAAWSTTAPPGREGQCRARPGRAAGESRRRRPGRRHAFQGRHADLRGGSGAEKIRDESAGPQPGIPDARPRRQGAGRRHRSGRAATRYGRPLRTDRRSEPSDNIRIKRTALTSLAMLPAETNRALYQQYIRDKDDKLRASAAEGFARLRNPADTPMLDQAWKDEVKPAGSSGARFRSGHARPGRLSEFSPFHTSLTTWIRLPIAESLSRI